MLTWFPNGPLDVDHGTGARADRRASLALAVENLDSALTSFSRARRTLTFTVATGSPSATGV